jgi:hypothetical protein
MKWLKGLIGQKEQKDCCKVKLVEVKGENDKKECCQK